MATFAWTFSKTNGVLHTGELILCNVAVLATTSRLDGRTLKDCHAFGYAHTDDILCWQIP